MQKSVRTYHKREPWLLLFAAVSLMALVTAFTAASASTPARPAPAVKATSFFVRLFHVVSGPTSWTCSSYSQGVTEFTPDTTVPPPPTHHTASVTITQAIHSVVGDTSFTSLPVSVDFFVAPDGTSAIADEISHYGGIHPELGGTLVAHFSWVDNGNPGSADSTPFNASVCVPSTTTSTEATTTTSSTTSTTEATTTTTEGTTSTTVHPTTTTTEATTSTTAGPTTTVHQPTTTLPGDHTAAPPPPSTSPPVTPAAPATPVSSSPTFTG